MKRKLIMLTLACIPLLFTSCFGLWGPHYEDIFTELHGNVYINGEKIYKDTIPVYAINKIPENVQKPYVTASWKKSDGTDIKFYCGQDRKSKEKNQQYCLFL